jgi:DMSO/TMAO reductase YedYZ molybdopterin-dependent catalytic subunit
VELEAVLADSSLISAQELALAARNHGMPLEAMHFDVTPVGLHYLLLHYDIPVIDPAAFRLRISGAVDHPLELTLDELTARPPRTLPVTMECAGNGRARMAPRPLSQPWLDEAIGTGEWTGCSVAALLADAGVREDAVDVVFGGADHGTEGGVEQRYERALSVEDAHGADVILAYALNGGPLPPQHGFPLRLVVPGWYGMTNVKWCTDITVVDEPFAGFQHRAAYRFRHDADDEGTPVTRMRPRALMIPPGIGDFPSRARTLHRGPCTLRGRAWSGWAAISEVQVSTDGGATWNDAELDEPVGDHAWSGWSFAWDPPAPGEYHLACRARDAVGNEQPPTGDWNTGGYSNNAVQRITVTVRDSA